MNYSKKDKVTRIVTFFSFVMILFLLFSVTLTEAADIKIGYINFQRILEESKIGKDATRQLEQMEKEAKDHIELKKKEIEDLLTELRKKEFAITPEKKKETEEQIQGLKQSVKQFADGKENEIQDFVLKKRYKIINDIKDIVLQIGQEEKFDLILERDESGVLFANPKYDITDKIIKIYDQKIGE